MSESVPTKHHLRQCLLFYFNLKRSATETHRLLIEVYPSHAPDIRLCQRWFARFKTGDFDLEDKERLGPAKRFSDDELKVLLKDNPCLTQAALAKVLNVTQAAVSKRLKSLGMVQRKGFWMTNKSGSKNFESNLSCTPVAKDNDVYCIHASDICSKDMEIHQSNRELFNPVLNNEIVLESCQYPSKRRKRSKKL